MLVAPFLILLGVGAPAEAPPQYREAAEAQALWAEPTWEGLLHYRPTWRGGVESLVDDPGFFLAPAGKTHPRAELLATLDALFAPPADDELTHAACRFIGRSTWLRERLAIREADLPVGECVPFTRTLDVLKPEAVTLVFPAAYMNSPASMFGHTLLVIDGASENRLLAKSVNYAAVTGEQFGPFFALRGLFGLYKGYYSIEPYYDMVEKYNDINHRDMWEYTLDFDPEEVDRLLRHIWELQNTYSDYYFLTENCSYNLLWLLEAARPSLDLTEEFSGATIPVDTIKAVQQAELVKDRTYRPSKVSELRHLVAQASAEEQAMALALARGEVDPGAAVRFEDPDRQSLCFSLAAGYVQYLYTQEVLPRDRYTRRFLPLLKARSKLGTPKTPRPDIVPPFPPEAGHASQRVMVGGGVRNEDAVASVRFRPAYHELLDPEAGFDRGAQIQFFDTELRVVEGQGGVELDHLQVVDVLSISPRSRFFRPTSWRVRGGLEQANVRDQQDRLVGVVHTASGLAWEPRVGLLAGFVDVEVQVGGALDEGVQGGVGPSVLWVSPAVGRWKSLVAAEALWFGAPDDDWRYRGSWGLQGSGDGGNALRVDLRHETHEGYHLNEVMVSGVRYF